MAHPTNRLVLRDLSPATRAVLAVFLMAVGVGYFSALVQLHFQHTHHIMPTKDDAQRVYGGTVGASPMEYIIGNSVRDANPSEERFNRSQMSSAFTVESAGWRTVQAGGHEKDVRLEREGERLLLLDWIKSGADRKAYDDNSYVPSPNFSGFPRAPENYAVRGPGQSTLERLLGKGHEHLPFNGQGSMRPALFDKSSGYRGDFNKRTQQERDALLLEREGEAEAILAWVRAQVPHQAYEDDDFPLPPELAKHPLTETFLVTDAKGAIVEPHRVKIHQLIQDRCVRCHKEGATCGALDEYPRIAAYAEPEPDSKTGPVETPVKIKIRSLIQDRCVRCHQDAVGADDRARKIPLDSYENFTAYCQTQTTPTMSMTALAQSTHAHLLAFAVLFALTGLIFSFTSWPGWVRFLIAPLTLAAQVIEIGFWWLSRLHPEASLGILIFGGIVGASLGVQIAFGLLDLLFGRKSNGNGSVV